MTFLPCRNSHREQDIILCYNGRENLDWRTQASVARYAPEAKAIDTSGDPYSYRNAIKSYWRGEKDLIIIEQDIELTETVFYKRCRHDWCTYAYQGPPHLGYLYRGLGCARFSARLQRRIPFSTFIEYEMIHKFVDVRISRILWEVNRIQPHVHGEVIHHHDYSKLIGDLKPSEVSWCVMMQPDGSYRPVSKELQPDGKIFLYEVDMTTGKRGKFIKRAPDSEQWNWGVSIIA